MPDEFKIEIDAGKVMDRFEKSLPDATKRQILEAMRIVMGKLDAAVEQNISTMFGTSHSSERSAHTHLADSVLTQVMQEGDLVVGTIGYDLASTPYARILEEGGNTPAHVIAPRSAYDLKIPIATFTSGEAGEHARVTEDGLFVIPYHEVFHQGAHIQAYHYIAMAVLALAKTVDNDFELAVAKAVKDTDV